MSTAARSRIAVASFAVLTIFILFVPAFATLQRIVRPAQPQLLIGRAQHTATILSSGEVLVVGGSRNGRLVADAELVDAATLESHLGARLTVARASHSATLLRDGRVLVAGGRDAAGALSSAEIYDPRSESFAFAGQMFAARVGHSTTELSNGDVLLAGGDAGGTAEVFHVASGSFELVRGVMATPRSNHSSIALKDGRVLVAGGQDSSNKALRSAEIFDPASGQFFSLGNMKSSRVAPTLRVLPDGKVQVIAGQGQTSMEMFNPKGYFTAEVLLPQSLLDRVDRDAQTELANGKRLKVGSNANGESSLTVQVNEDTGAWITTDRTDYSPGSVVRITGGGFAAGESVTLTITRDPQLSSERQSTYTVVADSAGAITNAGQEFPITVEDLGASFLITATGASSGHTAFTSFTDGPPVPSSVSAVAISGSQIDVHWFSDNSSADGIRIERCSGSGCTSFAQVANITPAQNGTAVNTWSDTGLTATTVYRYRLRSFKITGSSGKTDFSDYSEIVTATTLVSQSPQSITFGALAAKTYGNSDFSISATASSGLLVSFAASGNCTVGASSLSGGASSATVHITAAGSCTITASQAGNSSFTAAANVPQTFAIAQASSSVTVNCPSAAIQYTGSAITPCSASYSTSDGLSGSLTPAYSNNLNAGTASASASYAGDTNHSASNNSANFTISKADAVISVLGYSGVYDGDPHSATGSAIGVKGETLSGLTLGATFTNVPGGTANWTFTDVTGNYNNSSGTATIAISKANATINVTGYTGVYDGNPHSATGTAKGVKNETLSGLDFGASFTNVPGGTATWTYTDSTGNYNNASNTVAISISKADATIVVNGYTGVYDGDPHSATGTAKGVKNEALSGLDLGATFTNVPGGTATWTFTDSTGNYNNASGTATIALSKANATITVDGFTGVYDGNAHSATGTAKGVKNETLSGLDLGASFTNVPGGTATWTFTDSTGNYNNATNSVTIAISKADATIVVNGYTGVYDGNTHSATGSATGVKGEPLSGLDLGASFTNVPGGTATWTFTDSTGNYNNATNSVTIAISKADATITVNGYSGIYDGNPHGASGSAIGVKSEPLSGLSLGATFTNVPGGTATWTFTDSTGNYNNASSTVAIAISKADATITVLGYSGVYDGNPHGATGSAIGVKSEILSGLSLGASFTNVPGGTATWTFTDSTGNYNNASNTVAIAISKADATIIVNGYSGVYDGNAHGATGSATGVNNEILSGLNLGASFTNVPGGTASWTFTDSTGNYNNASSTVAITIGKADATITVNGYTGPYDGNPHGATGTAKGVKYEALSGLALGDSFTNAPGGTATWTFTDTTGNYNNATGTAAIVIGKVDATIIVNGYTGIYDGNAHGATGGATGVKGEPLSGLSLGANFTDVPGGTATWIFTDVTGNYNNATGTAAIVIGKVDATITVNGYTGIYDGNPQGATGSAKGVHGETLSGLNLGGNFTNVPGGNANWTFTDVTGNYNDRSGTVSIAITKANPTITVNGYSGTYDANAHGATGTAKGVKYETLSGLTLGATFTDFPGGTANWTFTDVTGNYNNSSGIVPITINKYSVTVTLSATPNPQQYTGNVTFTVTLPPVPGNQPPATQVTFSIGGQNFGPVTLNPFNGGLKGELTASLLETVLGALAPGAKNAQATFGSVNPNFTVNTVTTPFTITPKAAEGPVTGWYTGEHVFWTPNLTSNAATLFLSAVIQDPCKAFPAGYMTCGDIAKAKITFGTGSATSFTPITGAIPVGYINASDKAVGSAATSFQYNLQNNQNSATITIYIRIEGYYANGPAILPEVITVSRPTLANEMKIMSATFANGTSAGVFKGTANESTTVSGDVTYTNKGTNPQGDIVAYVESYNRADGTADTKPHMYVIKTNAISTLTIAPDKKSASFTSKATIQDLTDGAGVDGGALVQVNLTSGGSGAGTIAIQVSSSKNGNIWFAGSWQNNKSAAVTITGGSISIN